MFEVNPKYKAEDDSESSSYYHFVSYRWDMPLFFVSFDVTDERMLVQAAGTLGMFAILKFHPEPKYTIRQIEIKSLNHLNHWVTKSIVEAYEGQIMIDGEVINGIKYICNDSSVVFDPPQIASLDTDKFRRCIHIQQGGNNAA